MPVFGRVDCKPNGSESRTFLNGFAHLTARHAIHAQFMEGTIILKQHTMVIEDDQVAHVARSDHPLHLDDIIKQLCHVV